MTDVIWEHGIACHRRIFGILTKTLSLYAETNKRILANMRSVKKNLIYWLIIIAMVLQPIAFSFAMTDGHSVESGTKSIAMSDMSQSSEIAMTDCRMADKSENSNTADSCCSAAACCFAFPSIHFFQLPILPQSSHSFSNCSFANTDIAVRTKPPKHLST